MHQKCARLQLPSNRSPPSCLTPHGCAENAKGIKLLEFVLVATSKCPSREKTLKGWSLVLGYLLQLLWRLQGWRAPNWGQLSFPCQWSQNATFSHPMNKRLEGNRPAPYRNRGQASCIPAREPILWLYPPPHSSVLFAEAGRTHSGSNPAPKEVWPSRGRPAKRLNHSYTPVEVTGRAACEAHQSFSSMLFVFSLLIVNDHEMLAGCQPGHPFSLFLAFRDPNTLG